MMSAGITKFIFSYFPLVFGSKYEGYFVKSLRCSLILSFVPGLYRLQNSMFCSKSGKIYTGVCIDTCSTLGICAERNAIFNMIAMGEDKIKRVLAVMPSGRCGAPCGACRELMVQLMPGEYSDIEIMLDFEEGRVVTLGELTPEWWIK